MPRAIPKSKVKPNDDVVVPEKRPTRKAPVKQVVAEAEVKQKRVRNPPKKEAPIEEGVEVAKKRQAPKKVFLADEVEPKRKKKGEEEGLYDGFALGSPPKYIQYELYRLSLPLLPVPGETDVEATAREAQMLLNQQLIGELKNKSWNSWKELYFSLDQFKRSALRSKLAQEIYQNKVNAGNTGLRCNSCTKETVQIQLLQTRSGDEGTTVFGRCTNCGVVGKYY